MPMGKKPLVPAIGLVLLVFLAGCPVPPVVFHDGLPARAPRPDEDDVRLGVQAGNWDYRDGSNSIPRSIAFPSFHVGARVGQQAGKLCFEEGLNLLYCGTFVPFVTGGIGLTSPAVMLRGAISPLQQGDGDFFWQTSLMAGTPNSERLSVSVGPRVSSFGIGGAAISDLDFGSSTLRAEVSYTARAPWAGTAVNGNIFTIGLWYEHRFRRTGQPSLIEQ